MTAGQLAHDVTIPSGAFGLVLVLLLWLMWRMGRNVSKDPDFKFRFEDMFLDHTIKKASLGHVSFAIVMIILSWGFVYLVMMGSITEWYLLCYGGLGTAAYLGSKGISFSRPGAVQPGVQLNATGGDSEKI